MNKFIKIAMVVMIAGGLGFASVTLLSKPGTTSAVSQADAMVDLKNNLVSPNQITIPVGQTVQFNTKDGKTHHISLGEGGKQHEHNGSYSSGDFGSGEAWRVTFSEAGNFTFHDHLNPNINVLVVAYNPAK